MIKRATIEDYKTVAELALLLWPNNEIQDLEEELKKYITSDCGAVFIYLNGIVPAGFAQCGLRNDYVEGTGSNPVGYLEGVFVKEEYQRRGIAKKLLMQCEDWAKSQGCREFASDCELSNAESLKFHLQVGFKEANRIICFTKEL